MKTSGIIVQIVLALFAIFAFGVWVGRTTVTQKGGEFVLAPLAGESVSEKQVRNVTLRQIQKYQEALGLTREEVKALQPEFEAVSRRMLVLPKQSQARWLVLTEFHEELKAHLTEDQKKKADLILEKAAAKPH